jgi:hypothetical protein
MKTDILQRQPDSPETAETERLDLIDLQDLLGSRQDIEDADDLRRHFAEEASEQAQISGCAGVLTVQREMAQQAFSNWTYRQITRWAAENGLTVDFAARGSLVLKRSSD